MPSFQLRKQRCWSVTWSWWRDLRASWPLWFFALLVLSGQSGRLRYKWRTCHLHRCRPIGTASVDALVLTYLQGSSKDRILRKMRWRCMRGLRLSLYLGNGWRWRHPGPLLCRLRSEWLQEWWLWCHPTSLPGMLAVCRAVWRFQSVRVWSFCLTLASHQSALVQRRRKTLSWDLVSARLLWTVGM